MDTNIQTIEEFISSYPPATQTILQELKKAIKEVSPEAVEKISYGIPTFTLNGKNLVHFSAYDKHIGFYPGSQAIEAFQKELRTYETAKGTVKFPKDKPIPYGLVKKITAYNTKRLQK